MHELTEKQLKRRENRLRAKEEKLRREEEARQQAWDWFNERKPDIKVEEYEPIDEDS